MEQDGIVIDKRSEKQNNDDEISEETQINLISGDNDAGAVVDHDPGCRKPTRSCATCSSKIRIKQVNEIKRGQHIALPGQSFQKQKLGRTRNKMYKHHAIVKEVNIVNEMEADLVLIHFYKEGRVKAVFQTKFTCDLKTCDVFKIEYAKQIYSNDEVIERAESMLPDSTGEKNKFKIYNLFTNNCEHFATWCVVGQRQSSQVRGYLRRCVECLYGNVHVYSIFFYIAAAAIGLLYSVVMTVIRFVDYKKQRICSTCLKNTLIRIWSSFGCSLVVYIITGTTFPVIINLELNSVYRSLIVGVVLLITVAIYFGSLHLIRYLTGKSGCRALS